MALQTSTGAPFQIIRPQSFYTLEGVMLPSGAYGNVQVTENLLDGGRSRTQAGWLEYRNQTGLGPGSGPLITAVLTAGFDNQGLEGVKDLRKLFTDDFRTRVMTTATGITYRAEEPDLVTHDFGTPAAHTLEARLVGPDGRINAEMGDITQALLGNGNALQVRDVYKWVTGRESYLWRFNERPKQNQERALVLGGIVGFSGGFYVLADVGIGNGRPARGVRVAPQSSTGSKG